MKKIAVCAFVFLCMSSLNYFGQNKTISPKNGSERETSGVHKVMLIPFEPKLYLSEIDLKINRETNLSASEIKHRFRDGINDQLFKALKSENYSVLDLMEDTTKYKKETESIYQYLTYEYQRVPNQDNYEAPKKEKEQKKIEKGQISVETNDQNRFMNAKLTNAKLVPILYAKFKTDIFVFINQLDIKESGFKGPNDLGDSNPNRKIIVHYTVYSLNAKEINSGIAEEEFAPNLNNPKKIIDKHFSKIAFTIVKRINKGLGLQTKKN